MDINLSLVLYNILWMLPLGIAVGLFGTLIGAGGGFILVPILLLVYPHKSPETITSISLAVVFFNSFSGSCTYSKMKRIDYKAGLLFSCTVIPGAIFGAISVNYIPRNAFDLIFGIILVAISMFLIFKPELKGDRKVKSHGINMLRNITDADGINYIFSFNPIVGLVIGLIVGFLSSLLGIGGGIIHVPALVHFLDYPVHLATATSHFMLAIMSFSGSMVHLFQGALNHDWLDGIILGVGVIIGAPVGARLSNKLNGKWIIRSLAIALALVGIRILFTVRW
jgi:uncharacterized protein